jgi:hypothetical protein
MGRAWVTAAPGHRARAPRRHHPRVHRAQRAPRARRTLLGPARAPRVRHRSGNESAGDSPRTPRLDPTPTEPEPRKDHVRFPDAEGCNPPRGVRPRHPTDRRARAFAPVTERRERTPPRTLDLRGVVQRRPGSAATGFEAETCPVASGRRVLTWARRCACRLSSNNLARRGRRVGPVVRNPLWRTTWNTKFHHFPASTGALGQRSLHRRLQSASAIRRASEWLI